MMYKKAGILFCLCCLATMMSCTKTSTASTNNAASTSVPFSITYITLTNGYLKVQLDMTKGGTIAYISTTGSNRNLENIYNVGRYIQQSYYSGNKVDRTAEGQNSHYSPWRWNPVQAGDVYGNGAKVIDYKQSSDTSAYVKCIPMLWDMKNMPAEAEMEQWNTLVGNVIKVHCKLTCHRTDDIYGENIMAGQELPAVYTISSLSDLYAYTGNIPFTNDTISKLQVVNLSSGFWGRYSNISEHWMAFVDSTKWGMGVFNPTVTSFLAGMTGKKGGEYSDISSTYIAPGGNMIINKNTVYEYDYYLIVGSVDEIRKQVYKLK